MTIAPRPFPSRQSARQSMSGLHTWTGLLLGWLLYAMFLTGTVSYFREEISQWMRPEVSAPKEPLDLPAIATRTVATLGRTAADYPSWNILLPTARNPMVSAFWRKPQARRGRSPHHTAFFAPDTGRQLHVRQTYGGDFFYRFHFQFWYLPALWGRWLAGLCAMSLLVALVSGIIVHKKIFVDFFTFRWGKGQRSWLDAHNALSVFGLPFHVMICYSGLILLMAFYMPWGRQIAIRTPAQQRLMQAQLDPYLDPGPPSGIAAPLTPVDPMVREAQRRWGRDEVLRLSLSNPGDAAARVTVSRGDGSRVSMSPQYLLFDGGSGRLLEVHEQVGTAAEVRGVIHALHLGRFSDLPLRWLYFLVSLAGTAMVGTGLVLWTVKRRRSLSDPQRPYFGFRLVERLNIACIAGLPVAMAAYMGSNRLLPLQLLRRADVEVGVFFMVWALSLLHAWWRPARRAWIELLLTAAALLAGLPWLNALTTDRPLWRSMADGDRVWVGVELGMWALAALHLLLALGVARHRPRPAGGRA